MAGSAGAAGISMAQKMRRKDDLRFCVLGDALLQTVADGHLLGHLLAQQLSLWALFWRVNALTSWGRCSCPQTRPLCLELGGKGLELASG